MEAYLPAIPQHEPGRFLVIYLTSVDESVRQKLEALIASSLDSLKNDSQYQGQKPLYVPATRHRYQLEKEKLDQIGIFSELYQIAAESRKKGWERILLVDSRTVRQLKEEPLHAKWDEVSLVVIRTRIDNPSPESNGPNSGGFSADAGRGSVDAAILSVLFRDDNGIMSHFYDRERFANVFFEPWAGLYNPELPPLSVDGLYQAQNPGHAQAEAAACLLRFLPRELLDRTLEFAKSDLPLEELTAAPERLEFRRSTVLVLSLIPLAEEEFARIEGMLQDAIRAQGSDANLIIYPWLASIDGRRRDLYRLYKRVMNNHPAWKRHGWFLFLNRAILEPRPHVGIAFGQNSLELQARYILPEQVAQAWESGCSKNLATLQAFCREPSKNTPVERLRDPGGKYAWDLPPFVGRINVEEDRMPVFMLSRSFTDDEIADIKERLDCEQFDCAVLPWEKEQDGTEDDICRIFQGIDRLYSNPCVVFVDRQTLVDDTVIVAAKWLHYLSEEEDDIPFETALLGTRFGRVKTEEMEMMWVNLEIANMDYEDWVDEDHTTYVPLPGVVVPNDSEWNTD